MTKFEVTCTVYNANGSVDHKWTMTFMATDFGHAEKQARTILASNKDNSSVITRIEVW